jgi:hypothetical protein
MTICYGGAANDPGRVAHRLSKEPQAQDEAETRARRDTAMTPSAEAILRRQLELFPGQSLEKTQDGAIPCFSTQMLTNPSDGRWRR